MLKNKPFIPTPMPRHLPSCLNIFLCGLLANKVSGFVAGNINELAVEAAHRTRAGQPFYVRTDYYSISAINMKKVRTHHQKAINLKNEENTNKMEKMNMKDLLLSH